MPYCRKATVALNNNVFRVAFSHYEGLIRDESVLSKRVHKLEGMMGGLLEHFLDFCLRQSLSRAAKPRIGFVKVQTFWRHVGEVRFLSSIWRVWGLLVAGHSHLQISGIARTTASNSGGGTALPII